MTRQIKFRALVRSSLGTNWEYYSTLREPAWNDKQIAEIIVKDLQFTGLLDKNGKEIYEGDVLARERYKKEVEACGWDFVFVVDFSNRCFSGVTHPGQHHRFTVETAMNMKGADYVEIIGNIYENPELIK